MTNSERVRATEVIWRKKKTVDKNYSLNKHCMTEQDKEKLFCTSECMKPIVNSIYGLG